MMNLNSAPYFVSIDGALVERIIVIPQDTRFVDKPELDFHRQKLKNVECINLERFKNHMMYLFVCYWGKFIKDNQEIIYSKQILEKTHMERINLNCQKWKIFLYQKTRK